MEFSLHHYLTIAPRIKVGIRRKCRDGSLGFGATVAVTPEVIQGAVKIGLLVSKLHL